LKMNLGAAHFYLGLSTLYGRKSGQMAGKSGQMASFQKKVGSKNGLKTPKIACFEGINGLFRGILSYFESLRPEGQKFLLLIAI